MERLYPFSRKKNESPKRGGLIVKENFDNEVWMIEYDSEETLKDLEDLKDFPKITKDQLINLLVISTYNIVRIHNYELGQKGSKL